MRQVLFAVIALTMVLILGCSAGERQLLPESRDGMFYTDFAEAQAEATATDKYILLDMWRPG